jgi:hypothetical protein
LNTEKILKITWSEETLKREREREREREESNGRVWRRSVGYVKRKKPSGV